MQNHSTSEFPAVESDYKSLVTEHMEEIKILKKFRKEHPKDKIIPHLLQIAKLRLLILQITNDEIITNTQTI